MKKIYLLMAMVMFAATSFAVNFAPVSGLQIKPEAKEKIQKEFQRAQLGDFSGGEIIGTRSFTDNNGVVWEGELVNYGAMYKDFYREEPGDIDFFGENGLPWYRVLTYVTGYKNNEIVSGYVAFLIWPSQYIYTGEETEEGMKISTIDEVINYGLTTFRALDYGYIGMFEDAFGIMDASFAGTTSLFNGVEGLIWPNSEFTLTSFDKATSNLGFKWIGSWGQEGAETATGSFALNYEGEVFSTGFDSTTYYGEDFTELHIYDGGVVDIDSEIGGYYELDFDPVKHYACVGITDKWEVVDEVMPTRTRFLNYLAGDPESVPAEDITYFIASAYAELNSTDCVGEYVIQEFKIGEEIDYYDNVPEPGTMIPYGYKAGYSSADGASLAYQGREYFPSSGGVLTIQKESTFKFVDLYTNNWEITFPKTYFHNDPSDYTKYVEVTGSGINRLFGDKTANLITKSNGQINVTAAENGVIAVYSTTGALVKTVKAVAGQEVSIDLGHGLYIVRVGKTASKVIL